MRNVTNILVCALYKKYLSVYYAYSNILVCALYKKILVYALYKKYLSVCVINMYSGRLYYFGKCIKGLFV